jgi:hypothetical protein
MSWPFPPPGGPVPIKDKPQRRDEYPDDVGDAPWIN